MLLGKIYRFFAEIRRTLGALKAPLGVRQIRAELALSAHPQPGEKPRPLAALSHKKPGIHTKWMPGLNRFLPVRAARR